MVRFFKFLVETAAILIGTLVGAATLASLYTGYNPIPLAELPTSVVQIYSHSRDLIFSPIPVDLPGVVKDLIAFWIALAFTTRRTVSAVYQFHPDYSNIERPRYRLVSFLLNIVLWPRTIVAVAGNAISIIRGRSEYFGRLTGVWTLLIQFLVYIGTIGGCYALLRWQQLQEIAGF